MSDKVENRNRAVLDAGVTLAEKYGMQAVTRPRVAAESGLSAGTVSNAFGSMDALRDAVMVAAVQREIVVIIAQGLAERYPAAMNAPAELKQRALAQIAA